MMNRPHYENEASRAAEEALRKRIEERRGVVVHKLNPHAYRLDWAIESKGTIIAYAEGKCRNMVYGQYPDVHISAHKYAEGVRLAQALRVDFLLVIAMKDGDRVYRYDPAHNFKIDQGGRTVQKRDAGDVEPMIHIPNEHFKPL